MPHMNGGTYEMSLTYDEIHDIITGLRHHIDEDVKWLISTQHREYNDLNRRQMRRLYEYFMGLVGFQMAYEQKVHEWDKAIKDANLWNDSQK